MEKRIVQENIRGADFEFEIGEVAPFTWAGLARAIGSDRIYATAISGHPDNVRKMLRAKLRKTIS